VEADLKAILALKIQQYSDEHAGKLWRSLSVSQPVQDMLVSPKVVNYLQVVASPQKQGKPSSPPSAPTAGSAQPGKAATPPEVSVELQSNGDSLRTVTAGGPTTLPPQPSVPYAEFGANDLHHESLRLLRRAVMAAVMVRPRGGNGSGGGGGERMESFIAANHDVRVVLLRDCADAATSIGGGGGGGGDSSSTGSSGTTGSRNASGKATNALPIAVICACAPPALSTPKSGGTGGDLPQNSAAPATGKVLGCPPEPDCRRLWTGSIGAQ
jgi:hypothetical protein